nr:immunoglobulin heavy chain junction region [Macaca mulatta]MPN69966.1 immunoglobulin heavy chain junction region [Macaca mulatta]MPN70449.1 immunoglobulin heavy chain junction region [Macaca mulatta]MPN70454.1 immunoglobulin heavy chain junction region [Macaca mulatta]MPN70814.1 immunoglobulin heavy chain junction region [Macaca mulatta]
CARHLGGIAAAGGYNWFDGW